ncbi:UNKNOWN [Stylonychia lemnae]|uniref:TNase-like domain-containing protein n=1 Tax=Stylonychia lemnae TaxID=5949 RepID=A0A078ACR9_STYLE|nr:UNKNOWN [Stylonychia lemnae]|eukprot:CDW80050.1 UNKNOWN [Stylonychia lemnae]
MQILLFLLVSYLSQTLQEDTIKLRSIDPKEIKMESIDISGKNGGQRFNIDGLKGVIVKVHFRDKHLKKKGILDISAEVEEQLAEEEITYQNFNMREERYVWMLCNDAAERQRMREFLLAKEYILAVETDNKRYFGKYAKKEEKEKWKEANKKDPNSKQKLEL